MSTKYVKDYWTGDCDVQIQLEVFLDKDDEVPYGVKVGSEGVTSYLTETDATRLIKELRDLQVRRKEELK